ncbi:MAG: biopolymer transporter ExbD [bacterium]
MLAEKRRFFSRGDADISGEEPLNLVPIMNLFTSLIPFLLLSAAFFNISVINASVPALQKDRSDVACSVDTVTLMVQVLTSGYRVTATSEALSGPALEALRREIPRLGKDPDFAAFSRHLLECKQRYPKSDTVILVSDAAVLYQEVVQTMDAARHWDSEQEGRQVRYELFPNVVVAGML